MSPFLDPHILLDGTVDFFLISHYWQPLDEEVLFHGLLKKRKYVCRFHSILRDGERGGSLPSVAIIVTHHMVLIFT